MPKGAGPKAPPPGSLRIGTVDQLRGMRKERVVAGGRVIINEPGGRMIERDRGRVFIRHSETARFQLWGTPRVQRRGNEIYNTVVRPGGVEIVTVTDGSGYLIRRYRRFQGVEIVLIDNRPRFGGGSFFIDLPPPVVRIPRERYIVETSVAPYPLLYETLEAPPIEPIQRAYSLDEIRFNAPVRDRMRRVDVDGITFDTGSWTVSEDQYPSLQSIAQAVQ
jgi:hypothetical protein